MFLEENNKEEFLNENNQVSVEKDSFIKKEEKIKKSEINKDLKELEKINEASKVISKEESKLVATATEVVPTKEIELAKTAHKKTQPSDPKKRINSNRNHQRRPKFVTEFEERVIDIARVTKTVKGGRRFSFSALVVIGNKKGKVSWGHGKANEVPDAIKKAIKDAKTRLINVPIIEKRTIPHEIQTKFLASTVLLKPAPKGKGIIASGAIRAVIELAGYKDIYTKSLGRSRSKTNSVKATYKALGELRTAKEIAKLRGVSIERLLG